MGGERGERGEERGGERGEERGGKEGRREGRREGGERGGPGFRVWELKINHGLPMTYFKKDVLIIIVCIRHRTYNLIWSFLGLLCEAQSWFYSHFEENPFWNLTFFLF